MTTAPAFPAGCSAGLLGLWLLLNQALSPGQILLGVAAGACRRLGIGGAAAAEGARPAARRDPPFVVAGAGRHRPVQHRGRPDHPRSRRASSGRSGFVNIPLDLRDPYALAALACIITATPGTLWVELRCGEGC